MSEFNSVENSRVFLDLYIHDRTLTDNDPSSQMDI